MNESIWKKYIINNEASLNKDLYVDVLIIGGGITGLSIAYNLINKNLNVAVVEKNELFSGVTSKTTAKITYLQENIYSTLKLYFNQNISKEYFDSQRDAIDKLINIIKTNNILCDLDKVSSYLVSDKNNLEKLNKEKQLLECFDVNFKSGFKLPSGEKFNSIISVDDTYVFNPIKYLNSIRDICKTNDIKFYTNTSILKIEKMNNRYCSYTDINKIKSKYVVLALHYPYFLFPFLTPIKCSLEKSYICAFKDKKNYKYSAITVSNPVKSIRYYDDGKKIYKIQLNGSHNISVKNNEKHNFDNIDNSGESVDYTWSNIDIMTNDRLPYIGKLKDGLLIATGYNTWGMTNATLAGKIISDIILNKENKYIKLFNPKRNINIGKIINFPISLTSNIYSFIKSKTYSEKKWYDSVEIKTINNKKVGIYTDSNNVDHIVFIKCPHLGCNLIFNEVELTWDCPCHGSRFDVDGKSIEGPSNYNIGYNKNKN